MQLHEAMKPCQSKSCTVKIASKFVCKRMHAHANFLTAGFILSKRFLLADSGKNLTEAMMINANGSAMPNYLGSSLVKTYPIVTRSQGAL
jgi:hypothetical protein